MLLFGVCFLLFGPSLRFGFVYDDHVRIEKNPGIKNLSHPLRFLVDPAVQASTPALHRDNYRPLVSFNYALDYQIWGLRAGYYRFENILIHGINAALVILLAQILFGFTNGIAFLAGLFFLIHPVQTESVVWISSRSNLLATLFILMSLLFWEWFQRKNSQIFLGLMYGTYFLGLLSRENVVVLPAVLLFTDLWARRATSPSLRPLRWKHYLWCGLMSLLYIVGRKTVLGQIPQSGFWGGGFLSNLANVAQVWPLYGQVLLWPRALRVTYSDIDIVLTMSNPRTLIGLAGFLIFFFGFLLAWRRRLQGAYCLGLFFLLWLPGSNLIPLRTLFAERLLYPLLVPIAFLVGLAAEAVWKKGPRSVLILFFIPFLWLGVLARRQIHIWENDFTLWQHATEFNPDGWFGWYSLGLVALDQAHDAQAHEDLERVRFWMEKIENSFMTGLKKKAPTESAGEMFFYLARLKLQQQQTQLAQEYARRAVELRPDLEASWKDLLRRRAGL